MDNQNSSQESANEKKKRSNHHGSSNYLVEDPGRLAAEFPQADPEMLHFIWTDCDKDCVRARRAIRDQLLGMPAEGPTEAITKTAASNGSGYGFSLTERIGDMFADTNNVNATVCLAHCVSQCLAMGKGIAVLFKQRFGRVSELKAQKANIGECAILTRTSPAATARSSNNNTSSFVYYMITKRRYFHKPTYDSLRQSLLYMRDHMVAHNQTKLAMPRIGCGLDGLEWNRVKSMIVESFQDTNVSILVYRLE